MENETEVSSKNATKKTVSENNNGHQSSIFDLQANIVVLIVWWGSLGLGLLLGRSPISPFLGIVLPIVALLMEKNSKLVRSHAGQALVANGIVLLIDAVGTFLTSGSLGLFALGILGIFGIITFGLSLALLIISIIASIKGYRWEEYELPIIGQFGVILTEKIKLN